MNKDNRDYSYSNDGLIYKKGTKELYTGKIIDTADVIIKFDVVKGKKHGEFKTLYANGIVEKVGFMKNNNNEGEWKYFYPNGKIESIGYFKNNKPDGLWKSYYPDGKLKSIGNYKDGMEDGYWKNYDERGKITEYFYYKNGLFIDLTFKIS